jgi:hypothetical protein
MSASAMDLRLTLPERSAPRPGRVALVVEQIVFVLMVVGVAAVGGIAVLLATLFPHQRFVYLLPSQGRGAHNIPTVSDY